jgi:hypothetical protein
MALLELSNVTRVYTDGGLLGRRHVHAVDGVAGRANATIVTAFTDGCPGLRTVLINAGILTPPILDWFHLAMRFQHATQAASGLLADNARRVQAKAVIVEVYRPQLMGHRVEAYAASATVEAVSAGIRLAT